MTDDRLDFLTVREPGNTYGAAPRIEKIKLKNFKFFYGDFELQVGGKDVLIYGENGSGKSSIFQAMELLATKSFKHFATYRNIFTDNEDVEAEFTFTNKQEFTFTVDTEGIPDYASFIKGLSVFNPLLDYKKLLKIHYHPHMVPERLNLYPMFKLLLKDFPLEKEETLGDIKELSEYYAELEKIVEDHLITDINYYLKHYFGTDFKIESFKYWTEIDEIGGAATPVINMDIDFKENLIEDYHLFLNEARLSALAVSIYFVSIKKLLDKLEGKSLKILVLDDLLISLDMSNRLRILEILKQEFNDFQIFFFTHDYPLFQYYRDKADWLDYELYLDDSGRIPGVIKKRGQDDLDQAKVYFTKRDDYCCAVYLRKALEKLLKAYLGDKDKRDKNCGDLNLAQLIQGAKKKASGDVKILLQEIDIHRKHIFNPAAHSNDVTIHGDELRDAIADLENLQNLLK